MQIGKYLYNWYWPLQNLQSPDQRHCCWMSFIVIPRTTKYRWFCWKQIKWILEYYHDSLICLFLQTRKDWQKIYSDCYIVYCINHGMRGKYIEFHFEYKFKFFTECTKPKAVLFFLMGLDSMRHLIHCS